MPYIWSLTANLLAVVGVVRPVLTYARKRGTFWYGGGSLPYTIS
jgi:hypothetical protein